MGWGGQWEGRGLGGGREVMGENGEGGEEMDVWGLTYMPHKGQALQIQQREEDGEDLPGVAGQETAEAGELCLGGSEGGHGGDGEAEVGPGLHCPWYEEVGQVVMMMVVRLTRQEGAEKSEPRYGDKFSDLGDWP